MKWKEARAVFPDRWLIIDAIESHLEGVNVRLDEIAVLATTTEGPDVMRLCRQWQRKLPQGLNLFRAYEPRGRKRCARPPLKDYRHLSPARYYIPREERARLAALRNNGSR